MHSLSLKCIFLAKMSKPFHNRFNRFKEFKGSIGFLAYIKVFLRKNVETVSTDIDRLIDFLSFVQCISHFCIKVLLSPSDFYKTLVFH